MTGISTKGIYGLGALYYLTLNLHKPSIQISEISQNTNIPQNYLEQILANLKKAGFLKSIRGPKGGYALAMPPEQIIVYDILEVLEGGLCAIECRTDIEALKLFWEDAGSKVRQIFSLSLKDLLRYEEMIQRGNMYFI
ncbi:Rrf2 family transcriptional regulator [Wolinella succinogenes]|jgi:Rrf2 family protein|uniref:Rrf2 family transcriptional regulator n=1 Tax=Wolinella succinogenes TaxID=844 RepID=UPI00240938BE|nr:Rrf2 family transcriptional regulator [Wolinella succinogenes]